MVKAAASLAPHPQEQHMKSTSDKRLVLLYVSYNNILKCYI